MVFWNCVPDKNNVWQLDEPWILILQDINLRYTHVNRDDKHNIYDLL